MESGTFVRPPAAHDHVLGVEGAGGGEGAGVVAGAEGGMGRWAGDVAVGGVWPSGRRLRRVLCGAGILVMGHCSVARNVDWGLLDVLVERAVGVGARRCGR